MRAYFNLRWTRYRPSNPFAQEKSNIIVGTPGRLLDHINRRTMRLQNVETVVLDEADEMLNMGFIEDIEAILSNVPSEHQTLLFSATMLHQLSVLPSVSDKPRTCKSKSERNDCI